MNYLDTVYPDDLKNSYTESLCAHLVNRFWKSKRCDSILDVGCGKGIQLGHFCDILSSKGFGIDNSPYKSKLFEIRSCNFEVDSIPFKNNSFDIVFSKSVCEHVRNSDNFFSEIYRVLKPDGIFICMTPDWISQMKNFYDDFTHVHPFTVKSLSNCMKIHKFNVISVELFYQLPFVWTRPWLKLILPIIALLPDSLKWKTTDMINTKDRKIIRFSKEKMILAVGTK